MEIRITIDSKAWLAGCLIIALTLTLSVPSLVAENKANRDALKFACPCEANGGACVQPNDICYAGAFQGLNWNKTILRGQANQTRALKLVC